MNSIKLPGSQKAGKPERERDVLFGLIECYIASGKPIGSQTLRDAGFNHLSSATIRNYCAKWEEEGYLQQAHTSGGRVPTDEAFRLYAKAFVDQGIVSKELLSQINNIRNWEAREIRTLMRKAAEELSRLTGLASFVSSPHFDQDFVVDIKIVPIDHDRALAIIVTDFGAIQPEVLHLNHKLTAHSAKRIESYLHARLTGQENSFHLESEEEEFAKKLYNEVMVRFLVGYTNISEEEVIRTGFSKILQYQEFREPALLSESLALFENSNSLRLLLRDAVAHGSLRFWVGDDLIPFGAKTPYTSVITTPYAIHHQNVGGLGILGSTRLPYRQLFGIMRAISAALSEGLTKSLYKFKLTFRQPDGKDLLLSKELKRIPHTPVKLIEEKK